MVIFKDYYFLFLMQGQYTLKNVAGANALMSAMLIRFLIYHK